MELASLTPPPTPFLVIDHLSPLLGNFENLSLMKKSRVYSARTSHSFALARYSSDLLVATVRRRVEFSDASGTGVVVLNEYMAGRPHCDSTDFRVAEYGR
jgi:hypothetical protein